RRGPPLHHGGLRGPPDAAPNALPGAGQGDHGPGCPGSADGGLAPAVDAQPAPEPGRLQGRRAEAQVQGARAAGMNAASTASSRRRTRRRRPLTLVLTAVTLLVGGVAAAYWSTTGGGSASAATANTSPLTLAPATPTAQLFPGGQAPVVLTINNPNAAQIRVGSLVLDTSQGTGGFAVDGAHSGCGLAT